jgi:hypothetical protein
MDAPKRVVQIDDTRYVFFGADPGGKVDAKIKRALAQGATVTEAGTSTWIENIPLLDDRKPGIAPCFRGNKVKCERVQFTKSSGGKVSRESLGVVWPDARATLNP